MCGRYKHCDLIDAVPGCPGSLGTAATARAAFHIVFDPLGDARNFRPARRKNPRRRFHAHQQCPSCGLSMHATVDAVRDLAEFLRKTHGGVLPPDLGTHVANAALAPDDGESTSADEHGHFTFFESAQSAIPAKFRIVGAL